MKTYEVAYPITGVVYFTVECESDDEEAISKACMNQWAEDDDRQPDEWEFTPHVATGNVTFAHTNDIEITEVDDGSE